jgi:hypothetical protein
MLKRQAHQRIRNPFVVASWGRKAGPHVDHKKKDAKYKCRNKHISDEE